MIACKICRNPAVGDWLDFGPQALTNRFLRSADEAEYEHPLAIGVCRRCGTVQLRDCVPTSQMRPRFDWIYYNEPEGHLDNVAKVISQLPGLTPNSIVAGLTYKDESTLKRLKDRGFAQTRLADVRDDLGVDSRLGGIESIQEHLTVPTAERLVEKFGRPDVLLMRHVLEHSHDIQQTLRCLQSLVAPGGYVVLEMPDARRALERLDYSTVWEEHIFYFTPATLRQCLESSGFEVVFLESFFYTLENSLVAIVRSWAAPAPAMRELAEDLQRAARFVREFPIVQARNREQLHAHRQRGAIAFLGAGHLSAAYINLYALQDMIELVVDDNTNKQGLFMPGSRLPILPSTALIDRNVSTCLIGVRPEIEDAVLAKNRAFLDRGGRLASIFPDSRYALDSATGVMLKKAG